MVSPGQGKQICDMQISVGKYFIDRSSHRIAPIRAFRSVASVVLHIFVDIFQARPVELKATDPLISSCVGPRTSNPPLNQPGAVPLYQQRGPLPLKPSKVATPKVGLETAEEQGGRQAIMMRPLTVATGAALAACALDTVSAFHVPGKAPLALATGRSAALRSCKAGPSMKVLTVNGKKLSKFEAMRFKAGRSA